MENRSYALAAGIFVVVMSIAVALAVWFFGGRRESDTYLLETHKSVTGLNLQAQVRYRGIRAGKVEGIEQDPADPRVILVKISLERRFRLTRASTAQLGYQGVTGLAFVEIEDDGSSAEILPADKAHPPRLPLKPALIQTLGEKAGELVAQVGEVAQRLNRVLDEKNAASLARTVDNLATASESLKEVPQLLAAMRAALSEENLKRLHATLVQIEKVSAEAAPLAAESRELVKSLTATSQKLDRLLAAGGGEIGASTLPQFNALVRQLTANSGQLGRVLDMLEERPQAVIFGRNARSPGPGESGFAAPAAAEK
jgi:phospholipid/cholesterol/gamma-HCH transport system substrate-binding protein